MIVLNIELSFIRKCDSSSGIYRPRPGYTTTVQAHDCHELVFYSTGCSGVTTIDGIEYKFKAGDVAFIRKNVIHSEKHFSDGALYFFGFNLPKSPESSLPQNGIYDNMWDVKLLFNVILKESINQEYKYEEMISSKINELLLVLERKNNITAKPVKNLSFAKNYIDENYMQNISIESLAKMIGYSTVHFRSLFSNAYGVSPRTYLTDIRCKNAVELLKNSTLNCTEIAYQCGFSNSGQLTVMLKKRYNKTPLKIRSEQSAYKL